MVAQHLRLAVSCLFAAVVAAQPPGRQYSDEEVLAQQRVASQEWREHYNRKDGAYCGNAYLDTAALHVNLGPTIFRGRQQIEQFWNHTMHDLTFGTMRACEPSGNFTCKEFVLDDNTVMVQGRFKTDKVEGRTNSEIWTRVGQDWKIQGAMIEIDNTTQPLTVPTPDPIAATIAEQPQQQIEAEVKAASEDGAANISGPALAITALAADAVLANSTATTNVTTGTVAVKPIAEVNDEAKAASPASEAPEATELTPSAAAAPEAVEPTPSALAAAEAGTERAEGGGAVPAAAIATPTEEVEVSITAPSPNASANESAAAAPESDKSATPSLRGEVAKETPAPAAASEASAVTIVTDAEAPKEPEAVPQAAAEAAELEKSVESRSAHQPNFLLEHHVLFGLLIAAGLVALGVQIRRKQMRSQTLIWADFALMEG